jgi:CheY-like chemotaxis protein
MQGGHISVESKVNEGTSFSFHIPYTKGDESMLPSESEDDLNFKDLESIKILVAEDVELNQFLIKHILESWGCEVTVVGNGNEAVDKVRKQHFDLILMDIQMPDMDGITATKIIRSLNIIEKSVVDKSVITKKIRTLNARDKSMIPIIALTANALKGDGQRYLNVGMNGYISKPYTEEKLFQVINEAVRTNDKLRNKILPKAKVAADKPNGKYGEMLYDLTMVESIGKEDKAFAQSIITLFLENMPGNIEGLVKAGQDKNYELMSKIAHKMKSSIDLLGITSLKYTIRKLENVVVGDTDFDVNIEKVKTVLKDVFVQLKEIV